MSGEFRRPVSYNMLQAALRRNGMASVAEHLTTEVPDIESPVAKAEFKTRNKEWVEPLTEGEVKTLVIGCPHFPMQDEAHIKRAMDQDGNADQLVVNGDILDIDQVSVFGQERDGVLRREYNVVVGRILEWSLLFERVYVNFGNHDFRIEKYKRKRMRPAVQFLFGNLIDNMVNGIQYGKASGRSTHQVEMPNVYGTGGTDGWWTRIGDCVVAHPQSYYKKRGETARRALKYFHNRMDDVRVSIINHTHLLWRERHVVEAPEHLPPMHSDFPDEWMAVEGGCLCKTMNYTKEGVLSYEKPMQPGYSVLYQEDGVTDMDKTTYVEL